ncbi:MAG: SDR family NAD(P)-dependent oxidoreductase, partial [Steroidobacteraceae bacterium]
MKLDQIKAVITGGASGLGLATAQRLVAAGGKVTLLDVQDAAGKAAARTLGKAAHYQACDVTSDSAVESAIAAAAAAMGGLNLAVSCAGIATPGKLLGRDGPLSSAVFQRVLAINTVGTFNVDRAAAALMQ